LLLLVQPISSCLAHMTESTLFGQLVRATRKTRRLRIGQLAEMANTGVKHLGRIERGEKQPSFDLIIALAKAMEVSPAVFFQFDDLQQDQKALKEQLFRLVDKRDAKQLQKANRILRAIFET
jgi:transcriptional regulator with XRE-family HTH domain